MQRYDSKRLVLAALFAALTAVGALVTLVLPMTGVPFTLQIAAVLLSGIMLGAKWGFWSQLAYLMLGIAGAPVFAQGMSGLGVLLSSTGGYLIAFPLAAGFTGFLAEHFKARSILKSFVMMLPGLAIIYLLGAMGLMLHSAMHWKQAAMLGIVPFVGVDLLKVVLAASLAPVLHRAMVGVGAK